jgi:hypothetical protein
VTTISEVLVVEVVVKVVGLIEVKVNMSVVPGVVVTVVDCTVLGSLKVVTLIKLEVIVTATVAK